MSIYDAAIYLINKYKIKKFDNQIWYFDANKWISDFSTPLKHIIYKTYSKAYEGKTQPLNDIYNNVKNLIKNEKAPANTIPIIYFNNGYIDIKGFHKYKPNELKNSFQPFILPFDYQEVKENKLIDRFLNNLFMSKSSANQVREEVKEFVLAFCFTAFSPFCPKQFLALTGSGDNGKSLFTEFLTCINTKENTGAFDSKGFNNRFSLSILLNKTLAICDDASNDMIEASTFKEATGKNIIPIERKGENSFAAQLNSSIILSTNYYLRYKDSSNALSSRLNQVNLYADFKNKDYDKCFNYQELQVLKSDVKGYCYFIRLCYEAFKKLSDKTGYIKPPQEIVIINQELYKENNAILQFLEDTDFLEKNMEGNKLGIYPQLIYTHFLTWWDENYSEKCKYSALGVWKEFKTTLESKYRHLYKFDFSREARTKIPTGQYETDRENGWYIYKLNYLDMTKEELMKYTTELNSEIKTLDKVLTEKRKLIKDINLIIHKGANNGK